MDDVLTDSMTDNVMDYYADPLANLATDPMLNSPDLTGMTDLGFQSNSDLDLLTNTTEVMMDDDMQYSASFDPSLMAALEDTNRVLSDSQALLDHLNQQPDTSTHFSGDMDSLGPPSISSDTKSMMDMTSKILHKAQGIVDGKYSEEELQEMSARNAQMIGMLGGLNAADTISNSVSQSQHDLLDRNYAHHLRQMANESEISGRSHLSDAQSQLSHGQSASDELKAAARDFVDVAHYRERAEEYDPKK